MCRHPEVSKRLCFFYWLTVDGERLEVLVRLLDGFLNGVPAAKAKSSLRSRLKNVIQAAGCVVGVNRGENSG